MDVKDLFVIVQRNGLMTQLSGLSLLISNFIYFFRQKTKDLKCQLVPGSLKNTKGGKWRTALERYTGQSGGSFRSVELARSFASEKLLVPTPNSVPSGPNRHKCDLRR
jgi:hypothetical protein